MLGGKSMCGRFAITLPPQAMRSFFRYSEQPNFPPRYNVAPTQPVPIIRSQCDAEGEIERHFGLVRWGFIPSFVKDPKGFPLLYNARSEGLLAKASFRNAVTRRRYLFMADAFYEWRRAERERRGNPPCPYLFRRANGEPLALAGLWETWTGPNGEELDTACIITTEANGATAAIHDRLPAVLESNSLDAWLDPDESRVDQALALLRPPENHVLEFFQIGPEVNKASNDSPLVQRPLAAARDEPASDVFMRP